MKKIHALFIAVALLFLIATSLWGWAYTYVSQTTVPPEVRLSAWQIGGTPIEKFRKQLNERVQQLENVPIVFAFGQAHTPPVRTTLSQLGVRYEVRELWNSLDKLQHGSLWERFKARWDFKQEWHLSFRWEDNVWKQRFTPAWEMTTFGKPINATRRITEKDQVEYVEEKKVYRIDRQQLVQLIRTSIPHAWKNGGTIQIEMPLVITSPPETVQSLKAEGIDRKIIEFSTVFPIAEDGRTHNVTAASKTVHDTTLKPGAIFDYNNVIEETARRYGFKEAPVIYNGKLVPGIGGGICQVSSTLYNAVLRTGLEIVERRNHSLPVTYLPLGLDATFSEGYINFRFRNTTGKHLLIRTATENDRLKIKLFGTMDPSVSYKMETKTIKVLEPTVKYVKNPNLPIGEHETLQKGKKGYKVETYRIKIVHGKTVAREKISVDTYRPQPTLIAINTGDATLPPTLPKQEQGPLLEDGVNGPNF
ncbi:VanW family protein [Paenibacillus sp. 481]|uniref:VanW family protein n=1 Tax=Paenibacillus sp. 481 TaxID=2835869 RepID=UPI001E3EC940|nr:VanW family protein [Paenibacillus sp. 481]UHA76036.1 VanW family protein [Paenibacillus sp. 481]